MSLLFYREKWPKEGDWWKLVLHQSLSNAVFWSNPKTHPLLRGQVLSLVLSLPISLGPCPLWCTTPIILILYLCIKYWFCAYQSYHALSRELWLCCVMLLRGRLYAILFPIYVLVKLLYSSNFIQGRKELNF